MKLQTQIPLKQQENNLIDYNSKILLFGSCFSENIGDKFKYFKFQNTINPFGILFHPKAIETLIENAVQEKEYVEEDIFFQNKQWHCFNAHSKLSNISKKELLQNLNTEIQTTSKILKNATHIVITLGTAWIYKHIKTNVSVANCHKMAQKEFKKELLSVKEVEVSLQNVVNKIHQVNNKASIVFTVSPVRHIKDGFIENTQSKAHLISAIHQVLSPRAQSRGLFYFPSYEIMLDELRNYRFYKEDMLHPNQTAVDYIWEKFQQVWISSTANNTMVDVQDIQSALAHKPFNSNSEAHLKFLQTIKDKVLLLQQKHPFISF